MKENDKKGSSINPKGLKMFLEIKINRKTARLLFDGLSDNTHSKFYNKTTNIRNWLSDDIGSDVNSYNEKNQKVFLELLCSPFKTKVEDLEEAILMANKYLETLFKVDITHSSFLILNEIPQKQLFSCEIKVANMHVADIEIGTGEIYSVDPLTDTRKEVIYKNEFFIVTNSQTSENIRSCMFELVSLLENHFAQLKQVYQNYFQMLERNFANDELITYFLKLRSRKRNIYIENLDFSKNLNCSSDSWTTPEYSFRKLMVENKSFFKSLNFSDEEKTKIVKMLSFFSVYSTQRNTLKKMYTIQDCLSKVSSSSNDEAMFIKLSELAASEKLDKEKDLTASELFELYTKFSANEANENHFSVGIYYLSESNTFFSVLKEKFNYTKIITSSCVQKEQSSKSSNSRVYSDRWSNRKAILCENTSSLHMYEIFEHIRVLASKILMMTDTYVNQINESKVISDVIEEYEKTLEKYEIAKKDFASQFLLR